MLLHLSNRNLALDDVAVGIAAANGMKTWIYDDSAEEDDDDKFIYTSDVAIAANKTEDLGELAASKSWKLAKARSVAAPVDRRLFEHRPGADQKARSAELESVLALSEGPAAVARIERQRNPATTARLALGFASLNPGYSQRAPPSLNCRSKISPSVA